MFSRNHSFAALALAGLAACTDGTRAADPAPAPDGGPPTNIPADCTRIDGGRVCTCPDGYAPSPSSSARCLLTDECEGPDTGCDPHAGCIPLVGSHQCVCEMGYSGDGGVCTAAHEECADCDVHASCVFADGGYGCQCDATFTGDGQTCRGDAQHPCAGGGGCAADATCAPNNGEPKCTCRTGFVGDGMTCVTDPCLGGGGCSTHATCSVSGTARVCTCSSGYEGDGVTCRQVGPCGQVSCAPDATCSVVEGTATCNCNPGYRGDGMTCTLATPQGSSCSDPGGEEECAHDDYCQERGDSGVCSHYCSGAWDCAAGNDCVDSACYDSCETDHACRDPALGCWRKTDFDGVSKSLCLPSCTSDPRGICGYQQVCDPAAGGCVETNCWANAECPGGQVCATVSNKCVADCRSSGVACRSGSFCSGTTGLCEFGFQQHCANEDGECSEGLKCVNLNRSASFPDYRCMQKCASTAACPSGWTCQSSYGYTCTRSCQPMFNDCYTGTTCQQVYSWMCLIPL